MASTTISYSDKTVTPSSLPVSPFHRLPGYIPANSQLNVPDGLSFTPLPSCPSADTSEAGFAAILGYVGPVVASGSSSI